MGQACCKLSQSGKTLAPPDLLFQLLYVAKIGKKKDMARRLPLSGLYQSGVDEQWNRCRITNAAQDLPLGYSVVFFSSCSIGRKHGRSSIRS